jgi:tRNA (cytidine/uridine-2'-O-)-methyltransferase
MDGKHMQRARLDYHEYARVLRHASQPAFLASQQPHDRLFALTTQGSSTMYGAHCRATVVFGSETKGLLAPEALIRPRPAFEGADAHKASAEPVQR